jgi:hypothetical protein
MSDTNAATTKRTPPGGMRQSDWLRAPDGGEIRVNVERGYDCRERCEHEPPVKSGGDAQRIQRGDQWCFEYRRGDVAVSLRCISYLRNGVLDPSWVAMRDRFAREDRRRPSADEQLPILGAYLDVHRKVDDPEAQECDVFGRCELSFMGYLQSAEFWQKTHVDALLPLALHPIDEIDFAAVVDAMGPLWAKMAGVVAASSVSSSTDA